MSQLVKSQLSKLPPDAQKMITNVVEKNPDLLLRMAQDLQSEKSAGKSDQDSFMSIASKYKDELQKLQK